MLILVVVVSLIVIAIPIKRFFFRIGNPININISNAYYHHASKPIIVWSPMGNWFELGYNEMPNADVATFEALATDFGKDKNTVYWRATPQNVDANSFVVNEKEGIVKDKNNVYALTNEYTTGLLQVVDGANPATYKLMDTGIKDVRAFYWHKDDKYIFYKNKKANVLYDSFKLINNTIAIDAATLYIVNDNDIVAKQPLKVTNTKAINDYYAQINNSVVMSNWDKEFTLLNFDKIDTINVINDKTIIVNNSLVYNGERYADIDAATFNYIEYNYAKDKNNVYLNCKTIPNAAVNSFKPITDEYAKDKTHVYYNLVIVEGANPASFKRNTNIADEWTDGNKKYKYGVVIK